jgi:hypothetical protein
MDRGIDAERSGKLPAIAAREKKRSFMRGMQKVRYRKRRWCLAGAADGEIAETDDRHAGATSAQMHARGGYRAVYSRKGLEQAARAGLPPERGLAHYIYPKRA